MIRFNFISANEGIVASKRQITRRKFNKCAHKLLNKKKKRKGILFLQFINILK
jgi:hypothetical protein